MTRLKAFVYCFISFTFGMFMMWTGLGFAYFSGKIVRGAEAQQDQALFWEAIHNKVPYTENGYRFISSTHDKTILVQKAKKKSLPNIGGK